MSDTGYVLGQSERAARRLAIQDQHFAEPSERLLDDLQLQPDDHVVELGCGPGGLTRRILAWLGPAGVVVGVDSSPAMLEQAAKAVAGAGPGRFEPVRANVADLGPWLAGTDVVVGRAVLHHVPEAEFVVGRLRAAVRPGTRVGFIEPDFRTPLARLAYLEATGRPELAPLRVWATAINQLYAAWRISPAVGPTLAATLDEAGYRNVRSVWHEFPCDALVVENITLWYDEVRDTLARLDILTPAETDEQQRLLHDLPPGPHPAVWGVHRVTGEA